MRILALACIWCLGCGAGTAPSTESEHATETPTEAHPGCTATYDIVSTPGTRYEDVATDAVIPGPSMA